MKSLAIKATITAIWVSTVVTVGVLAGFRSFSTWIALAGLAVVPPLITLSLWRLPRPTMSESIQKELR